MSRLVSFLCAGLLLSLAGCGTATPTSFIPIPAASSSPGVRTVVTFGDSVPAGTACGCDPFPLLYARAQRATSVDLAVGGYQSTDVLRQLPSTRAQVSSASIVLVMIGANDLEAAFDAQTPFYAAARQVEANVTATVTWIEQVHKVPVIILGYWNVVLDGQVGRSQYTSGQIQESIDATRQANEALQNAANSTGATYVSTDSAFHGTDGNGDATSLLAPDGDHPNAAGHRAIAALLPPLDDVSTG